MTQFRSPARPLTVAIVGSGPSAFYAAEALLQSGHAVQINMIERLPTPFGLVRNGVAPDHPKLKQSILVYDRIARSPSFNYFGNVCVGEDISVAELSILHHAVIFACGAQTDRRLDVPGEDLPGSHSATEFVGWYNGHPDFRDRCFDLSQEAVAVIGQGNVALDVARILSKTADELKHTEIAAHALEVLSESKVKEIHLIGRRGPAQAKFTPHELQEFGTLADCAPQIDPSDIDLDSESKIEVADKMSRSLAKNLDIFSRFAIAVGSDKGRRCRFHFLRSPKSILGQQRVEAIRLCRNLLRGRAFHQFVEETGELTDLPCGLVFRAVGYRGVAINGVPFDEVRSIFPNIEGRLTTKEGRDILGWYATGWIKRGPSGIIGTNRADAMDTVAKLLADLPLLGGNDKRSAAGLVTHLEARNVRHVSYACWDEINRHEIQAGVFAGKPREKVTRVAEMLEIARVSPHCTPAAEPLQSP